jgi:hypothetical protein
MATANTRLPAEENSLYKPDLGSSEPWEVQLLREQPPGSLVGIAREGRLTSQSPIGPAHVGLTIIDESVLALVDLALSRGRNITFVYPAPAGEVSVLLAAQILIRRFLQKAPSQSVGLLTSDTTTASRTWEGLGISSPGSRASISDVFPCYRAGPHGESPMGRKEFKGILIGRQFGNWPVDAVIVDHLSGPVIDDVTVPAVRVFADPLDPALAKLASQGELVWGWSGSDLLALGELTSPESAKRVPFSVASDRLETMASGVQATIHVAHHPQAELSLRRIREDLGALTKMVGPLSPLHIRKGIKVAWHHVSTLISLPCRPSEFDRLAGAPPIAARSTSTFEPEIAAWARTLGGDLSELSGVLASDIADLRAALEDGDPFAAELEAIISEPGALIVVRTHTAARALISSMGGDPGSNRIDGARVVALGRLHREGKSEKAVVVGMPARWDWHRLDSGLAPDLHVLVLGEADAHHGKTALAGLQTSRARWSRRESRVPVWKELVRTEPPPASPLPGVRADVSIVNARETKPEPDPFSSFEHLLPSTPLVVGDEGVEEAIARETDAGDWEAAVDAVEVETDAGTILLPSDRFVDVRRGDEIIECRADALEPGTYLLVDRRAGRLGLLGAISDRLKRARPDLFAANLLISDWRTTVRRIFQSRAITRVQLFESMRSVGFEKTYQAARGYVDQDGPLAPRDLPDLQRLNRALDMGLTDLRTREVFAAVQRVRTFRRAVGKALVTAAHDSVVASDPVRVDDATGLSAADLRELVLEARILELRHCQQRLPLTEMGQLKQR